MTESQSNAPVLEPPRQHPELVAVTPSRPVEPRGRALQLLGHLIPTLLALGCVVCLIYVGQRYGWIMPKFSTLYGEPGPVKDDWCSEHSVPESICVECRKECMPRGKERGWCRKHGVHECPLCFPELAQSAAPAIVTAEDRARADRALAFASRIENNSKCKLHERRIQIADDEVIARLGIDIGPVLEHAVHEVVSAPGDLSFDPTRVARLSARVPGTIWRIEKHIGDKVRRGDVLALIDAAEVGRAKAEFQQALTQVGLKTKTLARLRDLEGSSIAGRDVGEAEAALDEAQVRLLTSEQALANLGLPLRAEDVSGLSPTEVARRMQFLGLPETLVKDVANKTGSNNLIAVVAPLDGEVVLRSGAASETADPMKPLFVIANTSRLRLTLHVGLEDVNKLKPGQKVRFQHAGHADTDEGCVVWISPTADEKARTVPVRVDLPNPAGRHHANTFGTARVVLREEPRAVVVPSAAVHWEGDCHVVFVRDKNYDKPGGLKVFHVRSVRPGAQDVASGQPITEIAAGLLPGELVATANSGILRTELLKNNLGAG